VVSESEKSRKISFEKLLKISKKAYKSEVKRKKE